MLYTHRHIDTQTHRQTDRRTDRQKDRDRNVYTAYSSIAYITYIAGVT